uniref:Uncharacterized protein n=1 Tax=Romanomermis culicivorax TaxID=13658 RepID=A0A915HKM1_ROMCU
MNEQYRNYNENLDRQMVSYNNNANDNPNNRSFNNDVRTTDEWRHDRGCYHKCDCHTVTPHFNPTVPPLPLEQHFYGLPAPLRSAADTTAHSLDAVASSQPMPATNMVAASPTTANIAASIAPCIIGWDSTEPQVQNFFSILKSKNPDFIPLVCMKAAQ